MVMKPVQADVCEDDVTPWETWRPEPAGHLDPEDVAAAWCVQWRRRRESEAVR